LRDWKGGGGVAFGKGVFISSPIFVKGYINVIPAGPCVNNDCLKADGPDAAKKYEDTHSNEKEMRGR
jgi:hypothetical protein